MLGLLFIDTVEEAFVGTISKCSCGNFALFARQNFLSMDNATSGYSNNQKWSSIIYFEIHIHSELYKLTT